MTYELTQWVPLAVIVVLTIVFYIWGQNEKRNRDVFVGQSAGFSREPLVSSTDLEESL